MKAGIAAINSTAWQPDIELAPGKIYYWRVRGVGDNTTSAWSATRAFTTATPVAVPVATTPPAPTQTIVATTTLPPQNVSSVSPVVQLPTGMDGLSDKDPATPPPAVPAPTNTTDWTKLIIFFGAALLVVAVVGVATLIVLTRKIGRMGRGQSG